MQRHSETEAAMGSKVKMNEKPAGSARGMAVKSLIAALPALADRKSVV